MEVYLGIDGGGTQSRALLVDVSGAILAEVRGGPANVQQVSGEELARCLQSLIDQALGAVDAPVELLALCCGLAGASPQSTQRSLRKILDTLHPRPSAGTVLLTDATVALTGAFPEGPGILLIAGTGSVCLGRDRSGRVYRTGGWGAAVDDAGSGGWIGRRVLAFAFRQADGRMEGSAIQEAVCEAFSVEAVEKLVPLLHDGTLQNRELAALFPKVIQLAEKGDLAANQILNEAVEELRDLIEATVHKMNMPSVRVALRGGLLQNSNLLHECLSSVIQRLSPAVELETPCLQPVDGAVLEAFRLHHGKLSRKFVNTLRRSRKSAG